MAPAARLPTRLSSFVAPMGSLRNSDENLSGGKLRASRTAEAQAPEGPELQLVRDLDDLCHGSGLFR